MDPSLRNFIVLVTVSKQYDEDDEGQNDHKEEGDNDSNLSKVIQSVLTETKNLLQGQDSLYPPER